MKTLNPNISSRAILTQRKERRFIGQSVKQPWWKVALVFLRTGKIESEISMFTEVFEDDPRYDDAPYAETFLFHKRQ